MKICSSLENHLAHAHFSNHPSHFPNKHVGTKFKKVRIEFQHAWGGGGGYSSRRAEEQLKGRTRTELSTMGNKKSWTPSSHTHTPSFEISKGFQQNCFGKSLIKTFMSHFPCGSKELTNYNTE